MLTEYVERAMSKAKYQKLEDGEDFIRSLPELFRTG
jgi:hypothetical protein